MQGVNLAKDITNTEDTDGPQGTKGITKAESTEGMLVVNLVKGIINRGYRWASGVELARDITNRGYRWTSGVELARDIINRGYRWTSGVELDKGITDREDTDGLDFSFCS